MPHNAIPLGTKHIQAIALSKCSVKAQYMLGQLLMPVLLLVCRSSSHRETDGATGQERTLNKTLKMSAVHALGSHPLCKQDEGETQPATTNAEVLSPVHGTTPPGRMIRSPVTP